MATQTEQKEETRPKEQIVDPWRAVAGEGQATIDYNKLIGTCHIVQVKARLRSAVV